MTRRPVSSASDASTSSAVEQRSRSFSSIWRMRNIHALGIAALIAFVAMIQLDSSGLIAEERRYYDLAGMMQQLGLMPEAPAA